MVQFRRRAIFNLEVVKSITSGSIPGIRRTLTIIWNIFCAVRFLVNPSDESAHVLARPFPNNPTDPSSGYPLLNLRAASKERIFLGVPIFMKTLFVSVVVCFFSVGCPFFASAWTTVQKQHSDRDMYCLGSWKRLTVLWGWSHQAEIDLDESSIQNCIAANKRVKLLGGNACTFGSPREWLESLSNGAYTVIRCDILQPGMYWKVWGRDFHCLRLGESYRTWAAQAGHDIAGINWNVPEHETSMILQKLLSCAEKNIAVVNCTSATISSVESFMVTILWCMEAPNTTARIAVRGHIVSTTRSSDCTVLDTKSVTAVMALQVGQDDSTRREMTLPNRTAFALAKLSSWCSQRRPLERLFKWNGVGEVLLVEETPTKQSSSWSYRLLEGLTSNVFVLYPNGVLRTTDQGVLLGYARHLVIESAVRLGMTVDTSTPIDIDESEHWQEVFLSSAVKIITPVDRILVRTSHTADMDNESFGDLWSCPNDSLPDKAGNVVAKIYRDILTYHVFSHLAAS
jgi:hypothetical protein